MTSPSPAGTSSPSRSRRKSPPPEPTATPQEATPEEPTTPQLAPPEPTSPLFQPSSQGAEPGWSDAPDESPTESPDDAGDSGSPRRSTAGRGARKRALLSTISVAIATAGTMVHTLLTREGSAAQQIGLYLPDEEDIEAIADPAASIASRRAPEGIENPDVTDGVRLLLGVAGYALKQRAKLAALAAEREFNGGTGEESTEGVFGPESAPTGP